MLKDAEKRLNNVDNFVNFLPENTRRAFLEATMTKSSFLFWLSRFELSGHDLTGLAHVGHLLPD